MPIVKISIVKGKSREYKDALLENIHTALVESFKIPNYDRNQRITEFEPEDYEHVRFNDDYTLIEITVFPGRSRAAKKTLYRGITDRLSSDPGIAKEAVAIILYEVPLENWGIRGGLPADEVQLGFDLDV